MICSMPTSRAVVSSFHPLWRLALVFVLLATVPGPLPGQAGSPSISPSDPAVKAPVEATVAATAETSVSGKVPAPIKLDPPPGSFGVDLAKALKDRHSSREFASGTLSLADLAKILWAANGVNRENGKRTAPTPRGFNFISIYLCGPQGISLYNPVAGQLEPISDKNLIPAIGQQPYIASAGHVLAFVADLDLYTFNSSREDKIGMARIAAGCMAQNVYLACAALDGATCLVWSLNEPVLREALKLKENHLPLLIMPLGKLK